MQGPAMPEVALISGRGLADPRIRGTCYSRQKFLNRSGVAYLGRNVKREFDGIPKAWFRCGSSRTSQSRVII
jgi:hypothetical protein